MNLIHNNNKQIPTTNNQNYGFYLDKKNRNESIGLKDYDENIISIKTPIINKIGTYSESKFKNHDLNYKIVNKKHNESCKNNNLEKSSKNNNKLYVLVNEIFHHIITIEKIFYQDFGILYTETIYSRYEL